VTFVFARTFRSGWARPTCLFARRFAAAGAIAAACGGVSLAPADARADTGDVVAAEALFRSGRDLLEAKDYAHACPKLAESFRLDPATGTLLALAICHERDGKLASAWGEYSDVASRSKAEGRNDREVAARSKVEELQSQLSTLTIVVPDAAQVPGLEVKRGGTTIAPAWFGTPVPVNGGTVSIDATAPGKKPRHGEITLAPNGDRQSVTIDPLEEAGSPAVAPAPVPTTAGAPAPGASGGPAAATATASSGPAVNAATAPIAPAPSRSTDDPPAGGLGPVQVTGLFAGAVGVVGLGLGTFFAVQAANKNSDSKSECEGGSNTCTALGSKDRNDALSAGNIATGMFIGGGVLAATGVALVVWGGRRSQEAASPSPRTSLRLVPTGDPHGFGGVLQGSF
jgi:hypothetical protein